MPARAPIACGEVNARALLRSAAAAARYEIQGFEHLDKADTFSVDKTVADAKERDYDALVLPGGVANPDALRLAEDAVGSARDFFAAGKPVAAICRAPGRWSRRTSCAAAR